jgi:tRNA (cmo5U34)-methyltransferase
MRHDHASDGAQALLRHFSDPEAVARYAEGPARFVPGLEALHRMTGILLAERVPREGRLLVLGAGGGMELRALAEAHPGWSFVGVDPSAQMLRLARDTLGPLSTRVELIEGYVDDAPAGPFDGAVCLLTLHFLEAGERVRTVREVHRRLVPGAPFVAAHASFPQDPERREAWLSRYLEYAIASGADPELAKDARQKVKAGLNAIGPAEDEGILARAGFSALEMFYAAFTWRGWVAYA